MMNTGDTAWILIATAMLMFMTSLGLALFYGERTRKKSLMNANGMSYTAFYVAFLAWVTGGYCIGLNNGESFLPCISHMFLVKVSGDSIVGTIPEWLFAAFQGMLAATAVAIISVVVVGRIKFSTWIFFSASWVLLVYAPLVHMMGGGVIFENLGALDYAGGTVIHVNAGGACLVLALLLGKDKKRGEAFPSSVKLTLLGAVFLWFTWFGMNDGKPCVSLPGYLIEVPNDWGGLSCWNP
ncbi:MAG: hypothetical protein AAGI38_10520 [Bacteroidota bacterium]